ncbi:bifunctional adenosylcobinamide kinase/adenosylcobinamide-phosphate guanylyltransferase [Microaerobacter geothermalis]|uniref:bifunctional adenosylcobinamide kinase/adenosylcobinamide-phosphate guanylyltransferase n=1 Tax=Microaerobacter geothermalis TaxID=674972 RepID=UPI001F1E512F|nr:bifunctional adenosylcobinamide kinase/adenosylcobinamide-phosphate guanylyltransferase [Microaerobacter geothermalis]MCF6095217.1 bifunctional adenosylcobinamide kinase/adenosylcobinamide-phosphate guanylyltransferase [Microaerobacter geothermalis]
MTETYTKILITGGVRCGKSHFAEKLSGQLGKNVLYLATSQPLDDEMRRRIDEHKKRRPFHWHTLEEPIETSKTVKESAQGYDVILVDCLTMMLSNWLLANEMMEERMNHFVDAIQHASCHVIMVTNEVGWGLVPEHPLGRQFRDLAGLFNQKVAAISDEVYLMVAGIPVEVKQGHSFTSHY